MPIEFAHPVERALAQVFDEHGIAWDYEPHTFVLERDADGTVRQALTPDFFLPELDLYVECTVMRQSLTGPKRRKVRLARERAGATIEIMFRHDFDRLARRWGFTELADGGGSGAEVSTGPATGTARSGMGETAHTFDVGEGFRIDVDEEPNTNATVVAVGGDVDLHSAPQLRARLADLADASVPHVVLDLSEATFLDSMALGVILAAKKRLAAVGSVLDLVVSTVDIRRIFEITMLDQVLDLHATRADAIRGSGDAS